VNALQNNSKLVTTEVKGSLQDVRVTYPPELVAAMRGLFPSGKIYDFGIHVSQTLATIAGGVFVQSTNWSPAITTYSEWAALAALFDEVKLRSSHLEITSAFGPTSTAIIFQIVVAPDPDSTATTFTTAQRLAESEVIHCYNMAGLGSPGRFRKSYHVRQDRPWAQTGTPAGASGTPAGCFGQWVYCSNIVGTASTNYIFVTVQNVVRLRIRA